MKAITWDDELADERRDQLIDNLAGKVVKHGMAMPSILFLEMHKPFAFLASQTVILASGFLAPFVGIQNVQEYSKLIENRENIELLIKRIELSEESNRLNGRHRKTTASDRSTPV